MNNYKSIENVKKHIQKIRKNSPLFKQKDIQIALGKVIIDLKYAQKNDNKILKAIFAL